MRDGKAGYLSLEHTSAVLLVPLHFPYNVRKNLCDDFYKKELPPGIY